MQEVIEKCIPITIGEDSKETPCVNRLSWRVFKEKDSFVEFALIEDEQHGYRQARLRCYSETVSGHKQCVEFSELPDRSAIPSNTSSALIH